MKTCQILDVSSPSLSCANRDLCKQGTFDGMRFKILCEIYVNTVGSVHNNHCIVFPRFTLQHNTISSMADYHIYFKFIYVLNISEADYNKVIDGRSL